MNKFSIVVPVYNVEKYIDKCLKSIYEQVYTNFEVIIVNDGSPDNSQKIIDRYTKIDDRFKSYIKENGGLSDARNYGVEKATGDYLVFIDSDDYIDKDFLQRLSQSLNGHDLIRYEMKLVDEKGVFIKQNEGLENDAEVNFEQLMKIGYWAIACSYAYNLNFWKKNNFKFAVGRVHEDFGLIPLCAALAKKICYINYYGYNYVQREGSIMNGATKNKKRAYDILYHFDNLLNQIADKDISDNNKKLLQSYVANETILIAKVLDKRDLKEYIKNLKQRKIDKYLLENTLGRKVKKTTIKIALTLYIKLTRNR